MEGGDGEPEIDIRLGQEVTVIEIDDITEQAVITTSSRDTFLADSVIVTVPLGVLKSDTIQFSPPLPEEKITSINKVGKKRNLILKNKGPCRNSFLRFCVAEITMEFF